MQGVFFNAYFLAYLISPRSCHAFVGYLEEEAVKTYTHALHDLDAGRLPEWSQKQVSCHSVVLWIFVIIVFRMGLQPEPLCVVNKMCCQAVPLSNMTVIAGPLSLRTRNLLFTDRA